MKENKNLEKQFKDGLKDLEAGPPDDAKGIIESNLIDAGFLKEKSEGRGGLWMFLLLTLLVATPLILLLKKNHKESKALAEQMILKDSVNVDMKDTENRAVAYKDVGEKNSTVKNEKGNETTESNNSRLMEGAFKDKTEGESAVKNKNEKIPSVIFERGSFTENGKIKSKDKKRNTKKPDSLHAENIKNGNTEPANDLPVLTDELKQGEKKKEGSKIDTTKNGNALTEASEATALSYENNLARIDTTSVTKQKTEFANKDSQSSLNKSVQDSMIKSLQPKKERKTRVSFDFSGAPQFNEIKYGSGSANYQTYINQSRQSEKWIPSFSAAFGLVVTLNKLILETGLKHSLLASDFSYSESYITVDTSQSHADTSGQWVHFADTLRGQTHYMATNTISFLEFPLLVGYSFCANKFEIEIKAGVLISLITNANTTILSLNTGEVIRYNELSNSPYRKSVWSVLAASNVLYDMTDRFAVFVQPTMKFGLNSIFKDNYSVTKRVQTLTLGIGLRLRL